MPVYVNEVHAEVTEAEARTGHESTLELLPENEAAQRLAERLLLARERQERLWND